MVTLEWSEIAIEDLHEIHDYIARDSKFYADRYIDKLILRTGQFKKYPKSGRVVPEFELDYVRELIEGNYRIIYQIVKANSVEILCVLHSKRLIENHPTFK